MDDATSSQYGSKSTECLPKTAAEAVAIEHARIDREMGNAYLKTGEKQSKIADQRLEDLGYMAELLRTKSTWNIVLMTFVLTSFSYCLSTTLYYALVNVGPTTAIWGFLGVSGIILCLAASLAEITSVYATAGGVYYQTFMLTPIKWRRLTAWICGWSIVAGTIIITLSVGFGTAQFIIACVNVWESEPGVGIWNPDTWQAYLVFLAVTLVCNAISSLGNSKLHIVDTAAMFITAIGVPAICITILSAAMNGRRSAGFVFGHFEPLSGWTPGWAFCVGLLQAAYTTSGTGMITSMCEEARESSRQIPKAIVGVVGMNTIFGTLFLISLMFVLPDINMLVSLVSGQPFPAIVKSAVGSSTGAFLLTLPVIILSLIYLTGCTTSASRFTWAFARDGGIPGSAIWRKVDTKLDIPVNALLLSMAVQLLLGLIYFGSAAAFNAFTGAGVIFLTMSYFIPVAVSFFRSRKDVQSGDFYLGKLGAFCNIIAISWSIFIIPVLCMPTVVPTTLVMMNYASPVFVGFVTIAAGWYWAWGQKNYQGTPSQI